MRVGSGHVGHLDTNSWNLVSGWVEFQCGYVVPSPHLTLLKRFLRNIVYSFM